jgi:hypothetical protein
LCGHGGLARFL